MKKDKKETQPKWLVAWGGDGNRAGTSRHGKIGRLPLGVREELNRRLQNGKSGAPLARWLNKLPETQAALARELGGARVTLRNLAEWKRSGFRDWQAKRDMESKIVQEFQGWVRQQETQHKLFGRPLSYFEMRNEMRRIFGMLPLTRADIPPGEDWDHVPTRAEQKANIRKILRLDPDDENEESAEQPSPAQVS